MILYPFLQVCVRWGGWICFQELAESFVAVITLLQAGISAVLYEFPLFPSPLRAVPSPLSWAASDPQSLAEELRSSGLSS